MILFKYPSKQRELSKVDPRASKILEVLSYLAWTLYKDHVTVTEVWRDNRGSPHYHWRAIDVAILEHGKFEGSELLREVINLMFPYPDPRDTIPPLDHGTGLHFHIQCKPLK